MIVSKILCFIGSIDLVQNEEKTVDQDPLYVRWCIIKIDNFSYKTQKKFKGTAIRISEDFSKPTLNVRRQLVSAAKQAQECNSDITSFRLNYKRLVFKYTTANKTFFKGFDIEDISHNPRWHDTMINNATRVKATGMAINGYQG